MDQERERKERGYSAISSAGVETFASLPPKSLKPKIYESYSMLLFCLLVLSPIYTLAAYCNGSPNPNAQANTLPVWTSEPTLVRQVANGKLYSAGDVTNSYNFSLVHIYGSAYEMGFAQGSLLSNEVKFIAEAVWGYMEEQVEEAIDFLPASLQQLIADLGLELALDVLLDLTKNYTGSYFFDELHGLADASGADYQQLLRIHLIGELTQGDCSMVGAWGKATVDGKMLSLRALDWDTDGPFNKLPSVTVYHPDASEGGLGHPFAIVGFVGFIGTMTGMSSKQLSIHEIGVSYPDTTHFGSETFEGVPFVFLLRDILQFDNDYSDTVSRIQNANRTCDLILGVGDGKNGGAFRGFAYSASQVEVYDDTNMEPWNDTSTTWHPRFDSVVYWGMDWLCPSYSHAIADQIQTLYGQLTPQNLISDVLGKVQTGDVHIAVYDLTAQDMYVSFMATSNITVPQLAYDRKYTKLDMQSLFSEPKPQV